MRNFNTSDVADLSEYQTDDTTKIQDLYGDLYHSDIHPEIYNNSKEYLDSLFRVYNRGTMVSFVGAGASRPLGIPDWGKLMQRLHNIAKENGFSEEIPAGPKSHQKLAQKILYVINVYRT